MSIGVTGYSDYSAYSMYTSNLPKPPQGGEDPAAKFEELDVDGSGGLSLEESGLNEEDFTRMDADGDGELTEQDRQAQAEQFGMAAGEQGQLNVAALLEALDTDGDGTLSEEESGFEAILFSEIDADGNGSLTQVEMENHAASMKSPPPPPPPEESDEDDDADDTDDLDSALSQLTANYGLGAYQAQSDLSTLSVLFGQSGGSLNLTT